MDSQWDIPKIRVALTARLNLAESSVTSYPLDRTHLYRPEHFWTCHTPAPRSNSLLELDERAKLRAALKTLSMVMVDGSDASREQQLLNAVLTIFGPVNMKYRDLLPEARSETAMACGVVA